VTEAELGDLEVVVDLGYRRRIDEDRRTRKHIMMAKMELRLKRRSQENDTTAPSSNTFGHCHVIANLARQVDIVQKLKLIKLDLLPYP